MHTWNPDFEDFCGPHLATVLGNIHKIHPELAQQFFDLINTNPGFNDVVNHFNQHSDNETKNLNYMQDMVLLAFYNNVLTRQQAAAFLEYRGMKVNFPKVRIVDIFESYNQISREFLELLPNFCFIPAQEKFRDLLKGKKNYECCYFIIDVDEVADPRIEGTLQFANTLKAVHYTNELYPRFDPFDNEHNKRDYAPELFFKVNYLNIVMRDLMVQAVYGENAKVIFPKLGIFDIDIIEHYVRKQGRPFSMDYYDVPSAKSFHNIEANAFYNGLHDELHRILISTISNPVFNAYLHLIDVVREQTGLMPATKNDRPLSKGVFTRDIWDAIDMECGLFLKDSRPPEVRNTNITQDFIYMMNTSVYTEKRDVGLCPPTTYSDTTWLVLIDLVLNKNVWKEYSIDTLELASSVYSDLYDFVVKHQDVLQQETSPARRVANIQSLWFDLPFDETKPTRFRRKDNYIELVHGKHLMNPTQCSKKTAIEMINVYSVLETPSDSHLFKEILDRSSRDWHYFDSIIHNYGNFKPLLAHAKDSSTKNALNIFMERKILTQIDYATKIFNEGRFNYAMEQFITIKKYFQNYDSTLDNTINKYIELAKSQIGSYITSSIYTFYQKSSTLISSETENPDEILPKKPNN